MIKPKKKLPVGRPLTLTAGLIEDFRRLLEAGNYVETCCQYLRVGKSTFYSWLERGDQDIKDNKVTLFSGLVDVIGGARAKAIIGNVELVQEGAKTNPWLATWWLSHAGGKDWTNRQHIITEDVTPEKLIDDDMDKLSLEDMELSIMAMKQDIADEEEDPERKKKLLNEIAIDKATFQTDKERNEERIADMKAYHEVYTRTGEAPTWHPKPLTEKQKRLEEERKDLSNKEGRNT